MKIAYIYLAQPLDERMLLRLLNNLPTHLVKHIMLFQKSMERSLSALGYTLLAYLIKSNDVLLQSLHHGPYGRPYIEEFLGDFNISRSNNIVICALSAQGRVGIDIEYIKPIPLEAYESQFTSLEWQDIIGANDSIQRFYNFWTRKEAIIKLDGRGLHIPLNQLSLKTTPTYYDGIYMNSENIVINEMYSAALAYEGQINIPLIEEVSLNDLL